MEVPLQFPVPSNDALAHSRKLEKLIRDRIRAAGGWIGFAEYMALALYAPGLGYYSAGARKLGAGGDFVTAPEISPMYARCLSNVVAPLLGSFEHGTILELGGGTGILAADMLLALDQRKALPRRYLMLDVSADLRARQQALLEEKVPGLMHLVEWVDTLPDSAFDGVILANEVIDALPVERFAVTGDAVQALGVAVRSGSFGWEKAPAPQELCDAVRGVENALGDSLAPGYESELSLTLPAWINGLAGVLSNGLVILADYGYPRRDYYHPDRGHGTLRCHYRHRAHDDPFLYPGLQDISAWVDFSAVADAARAAGFSLAGYTTQAQFLLGTGIDAEFASLGGSARIAAAQQARVLLMPGEMGEAFKIMLLGRGEAGALPAPAFRDFRSWL